MAQHSDGAADAKFAGSIPSIYDACLGDFLFAPYADELVSIAAELAPSSILETAAGTGVLTKRLAARLPETKIIATDLNLGMLELAQAGISSANVEFEVVDAEDLPFREGSFDLVVCQFGAMFFPRPAKAYAEARRVLSKDGRIMFSVWDRIEANAPAHVVETAVASLFPLDPPSFLSRTPYGYHDVARIKDELQSAGFTHVEHRRVELESIVRDPGRIARGLCEGSPLRSEIEERAPDRLDEATALATEALRKAGFDRGAHARLSAHHWIASA